MFKSKKYFDNITDTFSKQKKSEKQGEFFLNKRKIFLLQAKQIELGYDSMNGISTVFFNDLFVLLFLLFRLFRLVEYIALSVIG